MISLLYSPRSDLIGLVIWVLRFNVYVINKRPFHLINIYKKAVALSLLMYISDCTSYMDV